jgi:hypothetical protein
MEGIARLCRGVAQPTAAPGTINHALFDRFALVHMAGGLVLGMLGLRFVPLLILAVGWEVAEHVLKDCIPHAFVHPSQDTLRNAAGDVFVTLVGWVVGRAARTTARLLRNHRRRERPA